ncbi:serine/threonine-protein kinase N3 isoform X2 [Xenopus tropicalis]|uniref:Serine/threonine-protein kinase N3 isoform X2 n=1 Tax=Xenopus tropicalis TaxID=8364 RepID=A0A8J1JXI1_XENTR|nr:serine/threonine-protein kinase N3 isoform X2 [Xenopus tropicalis]
MRSLVVAINFILNYLFSHLEFIIMTQIFQKIFRKIFRRKIKKCSIDSEAAPEEIPEKIVGKVKDKELISPLTPEKFYEEKVDVPAQKQTESGDNGMEATPSIPPGPKPEDDLERELQGNSVEDTALEPEHIEAIKKKLQEEIKQRMEEKLKQKREKEAIKKKLQEEIELRTEEKLKQKREMESGDQAAPRIPPEAKEAIKKKLQKVIKRKMKEKLKGKGEMESGDQPPPRIPPETKEAIKKQLQEEVKQRMEEKVIEKERTWAERTAKETPTQMVKAFNWHGSLDWLFKCCQYTGISGKTQAANGKIEFKFPTGPSKRQKTFANPEKQENPRFDSTIERVNRITSPPNVITRFVPGTAPTIEDFRLQSLLGEGAFGKVYRAQHRKTGKTVAIKAIESRCLDITFAYAVVLREQRILQLAKIENCPFLTTLFASFRTEHYICLAMDFAEGGDLLSLLGDHAISQERAVFYSACMVLGLKFLHDRNIAHRDIKLENVLLDRDGYAKLTDFGISKEGIGFSDITKTQCGTAFYMAPEIFTFPQYTRSVDWWALGVAIYRMLVGKFPFEGEKKDRIIINITCRQPTYPPDLPVESRNLLVQLLNKSPEERLGSGINGTEDIMNSEFYKGFDWEALQRREVQPPFVPTVKTSFFSYFSFGSRALPPPIWPIRLLEDTKMALKELDCGEMSSDTET